MIQDELAVISVGNVYYAKKGSKELVMLDSALNEKGRVELPDAVESFTLSPDGKRFAIRYQKSKGPEVLDVADITKESVAFNEYEKGYLDAICFVDDKVVLFSGGTDGEITGRNLESGALAISIKPKFKVFEDAAFDGKTVYYGLKDSGKPFERDYSPKFSSEFSLKNVKLEGLPIFSFSKIPFKMVSSGYDNSTINEQKEGGIARNVEIFDLKTGSPKSLTANSKFVFNKYNYGFGSSGLLYITELEQISIFSSASLIGVLKGINRPITYIQEQGGLLMVYTSDGLLTLFDISMIAPKGSQADLKARNAIIKQYPFAKIWISRNSDYLIWKDNAKGGFDYRASDYRPKLELIQNGEDGGVIADYLPRMRFDEGVTDAIIQESLRLINK